MRAFPCGTAPLDGLNLELIPNGNRWWHIVCSVIAVMFAVEEAAEPSSGGGELEGAMRGLKRESDLYVKQKEGTCV